MIFRYFRAIFLDFIYFFDNFLFFLGFLMDFYFIFFVFFCLLIDLIFGRKKIDFFTLFLLKLLRLLLKVTKVTTGHQKISKNKPKQQNKPFLGPKGKKSLD